MSNPASPIRPTQILQDTENRLVTDAQIAQWNAGGGGTILEPITPVVAWSNGVFGGSDPLTVLPVDINYPSSIPTYASSIILGVGLATSSSSSATLRITNPIPDRLISFSYSPNNSDDASGNFSEIEIPYNSSRSFTVKLDWSGNVPTGWNIQFLGYRRSTVIDALALSNTNPIVDGVAAPGSSLYVSRADHVHPKSGGSITFINPQVLVDWSAGVPSISDTVESIPGVPASATAVILSSRMLWTGGVGGYAGAGIWGKTPSSSYLPLVLGRKDDSSSADSNMSFLQVTGPSQITIKTGSENDPNGTPYGGFAAIIVVVGYVS